MELSDPEDWLKHEKFDFNLNVSKSSVEEVSVDGLDEDDEEVFIGPLTHKEKCVSVVVQEKEDIKNVEILNPQQQALLLRETALINLKIKNQGTPGRRNNMMSSPAVAIVHPMQRHDIKNEFICTAIIIGEENKENIPKNKIDIGSKETSQDVFSKPTNSIISSPENPVKIQMSSQSAKKASTRLSMPIKPSKSLTEFIEPLPLAGETTSALRGGTKLRNDVKQKKRLRRSGVPKPGSISKSKSGGGIPSLLPSVLPTRPKQFVGKSSTKPLKLSSTTTQSISGVAQPQLKLSTQSSGIAQRNHNLSARKCTSEGTPLVNKKLQVKSLQQSGGKKQFASVGTPNNGKNTEKKVTNKAFEKVEAKQNDLITPVVKSRRSIIGRQLNVKSSRSPSPVDRLKPPNDSDLQGEESLQSVELDRKDVTHVAPTEKHEEKISSHSDILQKYKALCNSETGLGLSTNKKEEINSDRNENENICSNTNTSNDQESKQGEIIEETNEFMLHKDKTSNIDTSLKSSIPNGNEGANIPLLFASSKENKLPTVPSPAPLLIDIYDCLESGVSPVKINNIDPFETGNTPPPLIQLDVVLIPERPPEVNLIKF